MINKENLADLTMAYSINMIKIHGQEYCITASEEKNGKLLLINTDTKEVKELIGMKGGVMSILPIPEKEGEFLAIQQFYPVFDSENAEIVKCNLKNLEGKKINLEVKTLKKLPYVHRISLVGVPGSRKIIAATLCSEKEYIEDWEHPGKVYEYSLNKDLNISDEKILLDNIHKNHGMFQYTKGEEAHVLVGGEEGIWDINSSNSDIKHIYNKPISDLFLFDIDENGLEDLVCITPFHGDYLKIIKNKGDRWEEIMNINIKFGHAIWCGHHSRNKTIIVCNRGGERDIRLYKLFWNNNNLEFKEIIIDKEVGASNIFVQQNNDIIKLYAANHGENKITRYTIKL